MKKILFTMLAVLAAVAAFAQPNLGTVVTWNASAQLTGANEGILKITADIEPGWHVYGFDSAEGGPIATTISFDGSEGIVFDNAGIQTVTAPKHAMDDIFEVEISWWENKAEFTHNFTVDPAATDKKIVVNVNYMACNDVNCMPPRTETITVDIPAAPKAENCSASKCCGDKKDKCCGK